MCACLIIMTHLHLNTSVWVARSQTKFQHYYYFSSVLHGKQVHTFHALLVEYLQYILEQKSCTMHQTLSALTL